MKDKIRDAKFQSKMNGKPELIIVEPIEFDDVIKMQFEEMTVYTSPEGYRCASIIDFGCEVIMIEYRYSKGA